MLGANPEKCRKWGHRAKRNARGVSTMTEFLQKLLEAPLSTILVLAGLLFVFIGFGGKFGEKILTDKIPKSYSITFGIALIFIGVLMHFLSVWEKPETPNAKTHPHAVAPHQVKQVTFPGNRENSGSIFEELKTGKRQRFGSQDTKHNDSCWVGRRSDYAISNAFLDVHMYLPGVLMDRVHVKKATFSVEEFTKVEDNEITRWLGPLMVLAFDYGELDVNDMDDILEKGQTIRSYENIYDLYKPTDITTVVRKLFEKRQEHLRLVFMFPGSGAGHESPGIIHFEPNKVKISLEYQQMK